jgi:hypothetical protein
MRKSLKKQGFAQDRMLRSRALAAGFARVVEKPLLEN